jgi:methyl-accepting chemotaxis protein
MTVDDTAFATEMQERAAALPFWRRPRKLRRQITGMLVGVSLVAVLLFGVLNYFAADGLLLDGTQDQLQSQARSRAQSIELGANRLLSRVAATSSDPGIVAALDDFVNGFDDLADSELDAAQEAELDRFYEEEVLAPINELGLGSVSLDEILPRTTEGRWIQYHYTLPAFAPDQAGTQATGTEDDSTRYDDAMAANDEYLTSVSETIGGGDLLLIDNDGHVVYSADKSLDLGTSLANGPYAESALARLVTEQLSEVRAGDALMTDFNVYLPSLGRPVLFSAASIRSGNQIVGALATEIPVEGIDVVTQTGAGIEETGLDALDNYVVSKDLLLQSTPQSWFDDPDAYLDGIGDDERRRIVDALGSPVGVQIIDTAPVRAAVDGEPFVGPATNANGRRTYSSSSSINIPGASWVVVTEVPMSVARRPLFDYLIRMGIVAAVLLPLAALVGFTLARRLTRPIPVAVAAARAVADGERHLDLPARGNDEFGDLERRLTKMAATLERQEHALRDEFESKRQLLLSVLPPHLVREDGAVSGTGDQVAARTVIAVVVDTDSQELETDDDLTDALASASAAAEQLAADAQIDRIRVAADRSLFVAGGAPGDDGADAALNFALALETELRSLAVDASLSLKLHVGVSTGEVATGVLARGSLTFAAWGEPVRRALAISALSLADEILVDLSTLETATGEWATEPADDVVDLDNEPIEVRTLTPTGAVEVPAP